MEMPTPPGWYEDPTGRHEHRYWTGTLWSRHVATDGTKTVEPLQISIVPAGASPGGFLYSQGDDDAPPPRRRRRRRVLLALLALVVFTGAAAGGALLVADAADEDPAEPIEQPLDPLVATLIAYLQNRSAGTVSDTDAQCLAERIVDTIGEPRLVEAGVDGGADPLTTLTAEEIRSGLPVVLQCLDDAPLLEFMSATWNTNVLGSLNLPNADCLLDGWMTGLGRDKLVELYSLWAARQGSQVASALDATQLGVLADVLNRCGAVPPATAPAATTPGTTAPLSTAPPPSPVPPSSSPLPTPYTP